MSTFHPPARRANGPQGRGRPRGGRGTSHSHSGPKSAASHSKIEPLHPTETPPDIHSFREWNLGDEIQGAIAGMQISVPTPIQKLAIGPVLEGRDVIAKAETGTGKTLAFGAPMMAKIDPARASVLGLVLCPTRELAEQVCKVLAALGAPRGIKTALIVGGEPLDPQVRELKAGAQVVVGTPGRILDLYKQRFLSFPWTEFTILDEADVMLEIGFIDDVKQILSYAPDERQTLLFSATFPPELLKLAREYTKNPVEVATASGIATVDTIEQSFMHVDDDDRPLALIRMIEQSEKDDVFLVFCDRRTDVDKLMRRLERMPWPVKALHGGYDQEARFRVMTAFRAREVKALVATDVASRGLDVAHVTHVVNYGAPRDITDYTHRIGRTGRAGRKGRAITFVTPLGMRRWNGVIREANWKIEEEQLPGSTREHGRRREESRHEPRNEARAPEPRGEAHAREQDSPDRARDAHESPPRNRAREPREARSAERAREPHDARRADRVRGPRDARADENAREPRDENAREPRGKNAREPRGARPLGERARAPRDVPAGDSAREPRGAQPSERSRADRGAGPAEGVRAPREERSAERVKEPRESRSSERARGPRNPRVDDRPREGRDAGREARTGEPRSVQREATPRETPAVPPVEHAREERTARRAPASRSEGRPPMADSAPRERGDRSRRSGPREARPDAGHARPDRPDPKVAESALPIREEPPRSRAPEETRSPRTDAPREGRGPRRDDRQRRPGRDEKRAPDREHPRADADRSKTDGDVRPRWPVDHSEERTNVVNAREWREPRERSSETAPAESDANRRPEALPRRARDDQRGWSQDNRSRERAPRRDATPPQAAPDARPSSSSRRGPEGPPADRNRSAQRPRGPRGRSDFGSGL